MSILLRGCCCEPFQVSLFKFICYLQMIQLSSAHLSAPQLGPISHKSLNSLPLDQYSQQQISNTAPFVGGTTPSCRALTQGSIGLPYRSRTYSRMNITAPDLTPIAHRSQAYLVLIPPGVQHTHNACTGEQERSAPPSYEGVRVRGI